MVGLLNNAVNLAALLLQQVLSLLGPVQKQH
jgi:hypothetical protein